MTSFKCKLKLNSNINNSMSSNSHKTISLNSLDLRVPDASIDGGSVFYRIAIMHPNGRPGSIVSYIPRRFSDMESTMKRLKSMPTTTGIPPLPPIPEKKFFGSTSPEFVQTRGREIERFIRAVAANPNLRSDHEFQTMIGFPPRPASLAAAGVVLDLASGVASSVGTGKAQKQSNQQQQSAAAMGAQQKSASSPVTKLESALYTSHPWLRRPPSEHLINQKADTSAASVWSGGPYKLVSSLPSLAYKRNCKSNFLLEDISVPQGTRDAKLILSVYTPDPQLSVTIPDEKKFACIQRTMMKALGASHPNFAAPCHFSADKRRIFVVRRYYQSGSLQDLMFYNSSTAPKSAIGENLFPLLACEKKYDGRPRAFQNEQVATIGKQLLLVLRQCHEFNIPLPNIHLGNIFFKNNTNPNEPMNTSLSSLLEKHPIVIGDLETALFGLTAAPVMLPVCGRESVDSTVTHIDIMRIGMVLLSLAVGMPLRADVEVKLLKTWGTPWMPSWVKPIIEDTDEQQQQGSSSPSATKSDFLFPGVQEPLLSVLRMIFSPVKKCDINSLLEHPFFKKAKLPKIYRQSHLVDPQETSKKNENGVLPSLSGLKKKDVELFSEAASRWNEMLDEIDDGERPEESQAVFKNVSFAGQQRKRAESQKNSTNPIANKSFGSAPVPPPVIVAAPVQEIAATSEETQEQQQNDASSSSLPPLSPIVANEEETTAHQQVKEKTAEEEEVVVATKDDEGTQKNQDKEEKQPQLDESTVNDVDDNVEEPKKEEESSSKKQKKEKKQLVVQDEQQEQQQYEYDEAFYWLYKLCDRFEIQPFSSTVMNILSENEIDKSAFLLLTEDDIKSMGIKIGPMRKILELISWENERKQNKANKKSSKNKSKKHQQQVEEEEEQQQENDDNQDQEQYEEEDNGEQVADQQEETEEQQEEKDEDEPKPISTASANALDELNAAEEEEKTDDEEQKQQQEAEEPTQDDKTKEPENETAQEDKQDQEQEQEDENKPDNTEEPVAAKPPAAVAQKKFYDSDDDDDDEEASKPQQQPAAVVAPPKPQPKGKKAVIMIANYQSDDDW